MADSKQTSLQELLGATLVKKTTEGGERETVSLTSVLSSKKQIILYFSAHWCPPCQAFTPLLSSAFAAYKKKVGDEAAETEVVFVSRDCDEKAFADYHKEMTFPALPFNNEVSEKLMDKFGVQGIPTMIAIDSNGEVVQKSVDFRNLIDTHGAGAFPLTPERVLELQAEEDAKTNETLKALYGAGVPFVAKAKGDSSESSFKDLLGRYAHVGILLGDGDSSDGCYKAATNAVEKINAEAAFNCAVVYLGWSLYNDECDHAKLAEQFAYSINDVPEELRRAVEILCGGKGKAGAPQLLLLRQGTGLCSIDGTCEKEDVPVLVSSDRGLFKIRSAGAAAFPWDEAAMATHEEAEKIRMEELKSQMKDMEFLTAPGENGSMAVLGDGEGRSVKERLFVGDGAAVIGLYFSAHWCPPCRRFTPKLIECYEKVKAAGQKFEVVFVSSDGSKEEFEEYYNTMATIGGDKFMALDYDQRQLKERLSSAFGVDGIPGLVLLKPDGTEISRDGVAAISEGGAAAFPWDSDTIERVRNEQKRAALEQEKEDEATQLASGLPVVKRVIGKPGDVQHDVKERILTFRGFSTAGVPSLQTDSGVLYYELDVLEDGGLPQFGFALKDGLKFTENQSTDGAGDEITSWAVDGVRECKWNGEGPVPQPCSWKVGNTIGLAANIDKGMIAISKDGDWSADGFGVVFHGETIRQGVYPCFTASGHQLRYCFNEDGFKHSPPADSVWDISEQA